MKIFYIFISLLLFIVISIYIDAKASKRYFLNEFKFINYFLGPLNAIIHLNSPNWLKESLNKSAFMIPNEKIFPNLHKIRNVFDIIQREALQVMNITKFPQNKMDHKKANNFINPFNEIDFVGWKHFYLKWYGPPDSVAKQKCPRTVELIESMPEVHNAMFSVLLPKSKIFSHSGFSKAVLRYQMGIFTPNDDNCFINVNNQNYSWRDGEDIIFDDTFYHHVENNTDKVRVILFLDIERPQIEPLSFIRDATIKFFGPLTSQKNDIYEKQTLTK
jgi:beta-hydroxylase